MLLSLLFVLSTGAPPLQASAHVPPAAKGSVYGTLAKADVPAARRRRLVAAMVQDLVDRGRKELAPRSVRVRVEGSPSASAYLPLLKIQGLVLNGPDPVSCFLYRARLRSKALVTVEGHYVRGGQSGGVLRYDLVRCGGTWTLGKAETIGQI